MQKKMKRKTLCAKNNLEILLLVRKCFVGLFYKKTNFDRIQKRRLKHINPESNMEKD
jgi:hypothetical protein